MPEKDPNFPNWPLTLSQIWPKFSESHSDLQPYYPGYCNTWAKALWLFGLTGVPNLTKKGNPDGHRFLRVRSPATSHVSLGYLIFRSRLCSKLTFAYLAPYWGHCYSDELAMLSRVGLHVWGQYLSMLSEVSEESITGPHQQTLIFGHNKP